MKRQKLLAGIRLFVCLLLVTAVVINSSSFVGSVNAKENEEATAAPKITAPKITTDTIPEATVGEEYSIQFYAEGGEIEWDWITEGEGFSFPKGGSLGLQPSTGAFFGVPKQAGEFKFKIIAKNTKGEDSKIYTLKINPKKDENEENPKNPNLPEKKKYEITFDGQGGGVDIQPLSTDENGRLSALPKAFKKGYAFVGWYTQKDGGEKITESTVFTKNQSVYAHWKKLYDVQIKYGAVDYYSAPEGEKIEIKAYDKTSENKEFAGWKVVKGGDIKFEDKTKVETSFIMPAQDVLIEATYKLIEKPVPPAEEPIPPAEKPIAPVAYKIIKGANQKWMKDSESPFEIVSNAPYAELKRVLIDNNVVLRENYEALEGSTKIIFKKSFMQTLSVGKHSVKIESLNGEANAEFMVGSIKKNEEKTAKVVADVKKDVKKVSETSKVLEKKAMVPNTGDNSKIWIFAAILIVAAVIIVILKKTTKK
ncbi:MAG: InlB B-repeat-containing protein [Eubacteriales bacterium]|nr:InlB B-repeat-containing protein [Eubacteriales bacterium]